MSKWIRVPVPIKVDRLTRILQVRGADVYVHWTVLAISGLMIWAAIRRPMVTLAALVGWLGVLLIHECGHAFAAQYFRSEVHSIDLYPILGLTRFQAPWSRFAECVIVWGGVLAQAVVAIPVLVFLAIHGYSGYEPLNALLALFGPFSLMIIVINLVPIAPLDGAKAWKLLPALFQRKSSSGRAMNGRWR